MKIFILIIIVVFISIACLYVNHRNVTNELIDLDSFIEVHSDSKFYEDRVYKALLGKQVDGAHYEWFLYSPNDQDGLRILLNELPEKVYSEFNKTTSFDKALIVRFTGDIQRYDSVFGNDLIPFYQYFPGRSFFYVCNGFKLISINSISIKKLPLSRYSSVYHVKNAPIIQY